MLESHHMLWFCLRKENTTWRRMDWTKNETKVGNEEEKQQSIWTNEPGLCRWAFKGRQQTDLQMYIQKSTIFTFWVIKFLENSLLCFVYQKTISLDFSFY